MNKYQKGTVILVVVCLVVVVFAVKTRKPCKSSCAPVNTEAVKTEPAKADAVKTGPVPVAGVAAVKKLPRMVDLGAGKCVPCKMMAPILEDLKKQFPEKFEVVFIDVWENKDEADKYGIRMIPTQIFYDSDGKELFRHEGFYSRDEILAKWSELGVDTKK